MAVAKPQSAGAFSEQKIRAARRLGLVCLLGLQSAVRTQLIVWEWRAEAYVLRQQGHDLAAGGAACAAWSPDGRLLASGGDDARVKLWLVNS